MKTVVHRSFLSYFFDNFSWNRRMYKKSYTLEKYNFSNKTLKYLLYIMVTLCLTLNFSRRSSVSFMNRQQPAVGGESNLQFLSNSSRTEELHDSLSR